jgi:hypothetical protein
VGTFLVFRQLSGVTRDQYGAAQHAAIDAASRPIPGRHPVLYKGGLLVPGDGRAICIFDADCLDDVITVNERAGVPFIEVVEAVELRPEKANSCREPRGAAGCAETNLI